MPRLVFLSHTTTSASLHESSRFCYSATVPACVWTVRCIHVAEIRTFACLLLRQPRAPDPLARRHPQDLSQAHRAPTAHQSPIPHRSPLQREKSEISVSTSSPIDPIQLRPSVLPRRLLPSVLLTESVSAMVGGSRLLPVTMRIPNSAPLRTDHRSRYGHLGSRLLLASPHMT